MSFLFISPAWAILMVFVMFVIALVMALRTRRWWWLLGCLPGLYVLGVFVWLLVGFAALRTV